MKTVTISIPVPHLNERVFMPLSTTWEPGYFYSPCDQRFAEINYMIQRFYFQLNFLGDRDPREIQIVGSTGWIWLLKATDRQNSQIQQWGNHYLYTTDIDLRSVESKDDGAQFSRASDALLNLATFQYPGSHTSHSLFGESKYAQVTFYSNPPNIPHPPIDWTITNAKKAPLHNYDAYTYLASPTSVQFYLPSFTGAKEARNENKFLLNPAIFKINEVGVPLVVIEESEDSLPSDKITYTNKTLSTVIKTMCKMSMPGVTLAGYTIDYLTALANTPISANKNIRSLPNLPNGNILQSVLSSFYHVAYNKTSNDNKYIFEQAFKNIKIKVAGEEKSLYQVFVETVHAEFPNLKQEDRVRLLYINQAYISHELRVLIKNHVTIAAQAAVAPTPSVTTATVQAAKTTSAPIPAVNVITLATPTAARVEAGPFAPPVTAQPPKNADTVKLSYSDIARKHSLAKEPPPPATSTASSSCH